MDDIQIRMGIFILIEKNQEELIIISFIESMHLFAKKPDKPVKQKQKNNLENKLTKYIQLIQNIQRYKNETEKIFNEIQQYHSCNDEGYKEYFRIKVNDLIFLINKQVDFANLIRQTISVEQKMNRDVVRYQYIEQTKKIEKQIERKIEKLNVLQTNNGEEQPTFENINLQKKIREWKKNSTKYTYTMKALQTFEKRENNFIDYMGQADLRLFEVPQFAIFDSFTSRINERKIQIFSIDVKKQLQIISNTIDEMQNVQNLQQIQKISRNNIKKIENQGFFHKIIAKQKQKLTIIEFIEAIQKAIGNSLNQQNIQKYIKINLNLKPKIKSSLEFINSKLYSLSKYQQIFQSQHMKMTQQKLLQIFLYLNNLQKMLKINIQQLQQKIYKTKRNQFKNNEESPKYLNIIKYFQRLLKLIDILSNTPQLNQPDYIQETQSLSKNDEETQKLKRELRQKQNQIQKLSWRVNNLVPQLQNMQNEKKILQRNLKQLMNENNIWKDKHDKLILQLQALKKKSSNTVYQQDRPRNKWEKYQNDLKSYSLQSELEKQKNKTKQYQKQITLLKQDIQKLKNLNSMIQNQLKIQKQKVLSKDDNQNKLKEPQEFHQIIKSYKNKIRQFEYLPFFFGNIFISQLEQSLKYSLISHISKNTGREITSTQRIYAFDKKNPVNPHKYIDDVPDWVLLFKLRNGYIVGGFGRDPIIPINNKEDFTKHGFMFTLNQKEKFYNLSSSNKSLIYQYNEYYLIIGNSEIRFNLKTYMIENQFGGKFKYFETGNDTVETFFGSKEEKFEIETYEFYHLIFGQKQK